jgi:hypothetical protein
MTHVDLEPLIASLARLFPDVNAERAQAGEGDIDLAPLIASLAELFPDVYPESRPPCRECGRAEIHACGLCRPCYDRWAHAGYPESVPARQRHPKRTRPISVEYVRLRALGATVPQAARHAGITERAAWRHEARTRTPARRARRLPAA